MHTQEVEGLDQHLQLPGQLHLPQGAVQQAPSMTHGGGGPSWGQESTLGRWQS